ncbi:hypothetical protein Pla52o_33890 [Novipirellula galeiformis]|uniref:Uncharacterized protein n=1 Tax=Novipirellula galeiformis TaxID=2528004 RepID=A0A5C6CC30_9BACT|nr:hypothetical protein Pla52o_33890 [Novipirellula galeiformis]
MYQVAGYQVAGYQVAGYQVAGYQVAGYRRGAQVAQHRVIGTHVDGYVALGDRAASAHDQTNEKQYQKDDEQNFCDARCSSRNDSKTKYRSNQRDDKKS